MDRTLRYPLEILTQILLSGGTIEYSRREYGIDDEGHLTESA
jgi:hypothetical protein